MICTICTRFDLAHVAWWKPHDLHEAVQAVLRPSGGRATAVVAAASEATTAHEVWVASFGHVQHATSIRVDKLPTWGVSI